MDLGLRDRVYLVTGASAGLGLASATALVADGAKVVICSRHQERVDAAVASLGGAGHACGLALDLADQASAQRLVDTAADTFGRLDGAVLSVGGPPAGGVGSVEDEVWRSAFESVFLGPLRVARAVLEYDDAMAVTFVLSTSVRAPVANLGISNALRPGLAGAAKSLADEFGPRGSRVLAVLPGRILTDRITELESAAPDPVALRASVTAQIPLGRYGEPAELGRVAAFLVSPAASYLTGFAVPVDGGLTRFF
ncbi:MAG: SDR family oxidoreductase [Austwickia sp.]|mgnify:CR=1 FL=1|jgi:3-oxoacyl-[acyl-carrier protein] reductase|nr:SDR family oxidoreductase [Austwickia sp.]MBK8435377.1 SDR family oxidoreductase [Austwickia sp.]MBK9101076.1 SDR family oxidoreductase [Austwickia sp.]